MKMISIAVRMNVCLAGVLTILTLLSSAAAGQKRTDNPKAKTAVLYGFANVTDLPTLPEGPVKETCSHYATPSGPETNPPAQDEAAQLSDSVTQQLSKRLSKKMSVTIARPSDVPPAGSLVVTGCFVRTDRGHAAKRLAGMGMGASHLSAHVRLFYAGASAPVPIDEFDLSVKGSRLLPPLGPVGLAMNAASERRETLQADAKRLADEILKKLKQDKKKA